MKNSFTKSTGICIYLVAFYHCNVLANDNLDALKKQFNDLNLPPVSLDFENLISTQSQLKNLSQQLIKLNNVLAYSKNIQPNQNCELIEFEKIKFDLELHQTRMNLLTELIDNPVKYTGSIYHLPKHQQWYRLLTHWWLGVDISPSELKTIGENEFRTAHKKLTQIKLLQPDETISSQDSHAIEKAYNKAQLTVMSHMSHLFPENQQFQAVEIKKSTLGHNFPAPGYYNLESETFSYNPLEQAYNLSQVDWLFIHEAVPGHHYQNKIVEKQGVCNQQISTNPEMAFTEGWAAYSETLGKQLGLFQDPNSYYFAIKWQALRAMRVIIDVGIHTQGWSVKQAKDYWLLHFPEGKDVMDREINRIQKWPMQVNTYVYGKYKIEQLKHELKQQDKSFNEILFHRNVISLSQLPLSTLDDYQQLFNNK